MGVGRSQRSEPGRSISRQWCVPAGVGFTQVPGADLGDLDLTQAYLLVANLTNADLSSATLTNANLTSANLTNANLQSTTLTNATLTNANLTNANLYQATLTNAKPPYQRQPDQRQP